MAIIVVTPRARAEIVQQLPRLKAVLVEKPLGYGGEEGRAFVDFCRLKNVHVQVNYWRRGDELYQQLAQGSLADRIGRPQAAFATYGNGLFNNGSHLVDFIRMLLGEVNTVQSLGYPRPAEDAPLEGDVQTAFALTLTGGVIVTVLPLDFGHYREVGFDIWVEKGRLALYQISLGVFHYPLANNRGLENEKKIVSDKPQVLESTVANALYRLYDNLAEITDGTVEPWSPGDQAVHTELILESVLNSAESGCERLYFQ